MSATAPAAVGRCYEFARRRCRTLSAARVLDYLYWCYRRFSRASPSHEQIAANTGYCLRTVGRAVNELEALDVLRVYRDPPHRRTDGTYTRARTNLYRLKWPRKSCSHRPDMNVTSKPLRVALASECRAEPSAPGSAPAPVESARTVRMALEPELMPPPVLELVLEAPEPPPEAPTAPPWVAAGITRDEWLARCRRSS